MKNSVITVLILLIVSPLAWSEDGPRVGYFQETVTPLELLGEEGAEVISSIFPPDDKLTWQLSVPKNYDPTKPAGVMVFVGFAEWGGGKKIWNPVLEEQNIIWIGLIGGGDKNPLNERVLRAILAQAVLEREYRIDLDRYYLFGYSGGAHVAAILATTKPELFKGTIYYGDALSWGRNLPPKIELIRQNNFMFMAGSRDGDVKEIRRVATAYQTAGIVNTEYVLITNVGREMPSTSYFEAAIEFLDSGLAVTKEAE